jgi:hypothetical protein
MILDDQHYDVTAQQAQRFREAIARPDPQGVEPGMARLMREAMQSQLDDLVFEMKEYDDLRAGNVTSLQARSIEGIGVALIQARIARRVSQLQLAKRLSIAVVDVAQYEAQRYAGVPIERLQQVANALQLGVHEVFTLEGDAGIP